VSAVRIAPSILAADLGRLGDEVRAAEAAGADWIHVDVMDGHFVPNITFGPAVAAAVRRATELPVDVHLMIERPDAFLEAFADAGAHVITVHQETCPHLHRTLERIRELGVRPGVTVNPATPVDTLADVVPLVDLILIMSVNPGFGGQAFIPGSLDRIRRVGALVASHGRAGVEVEVDGGVDAGNARALVEAGTTVLVAGSAVFRHPDGVSAGVQALRDAAAGH
jgi:ribulose-phosphate 3-epimerase